ncbi:CHAT domain-containing protein, partial [Gemmatimonadota bacterium]
RRAFQLAGARTVVMSLWSVPDRETVTLMSDFYRRMKQGEGKARALQGASLAILNDRKTKNGAAHPLFWGAFVCVGEP